MLKFIIKALMIIGSSLIILSSPALSATITTDALYWNVVTNTSDPKTATTGTIISHLQNQDWLYHTFGEAYAEANEFGLLTIRSNQNTMGSDLYNQYTAIASWSETYTNNLSNATSYSFDYDISEIHMSAGRECWAGYWVEVFINDASIWSISDSVFGFDHPILPVTKTNPAISNILDIGIYDFGESFTIKYEIMAVTDGYEYDTSRIEQFSMSGTINPNPIPEPATVILLGSGLVGIAVLRSRLKKSNLPSKKAGLTHQKKSSGHLTG